MEDQIAHSFENSRKPKCILLFSGKRKCGKDFITDILHKRLGDDKSVIIKISGPIKLHWSKNSGLDLNKLLDNSEYKEQYRFEMIKWSESIRKKDSGYFCRAAIDMYNVRDKPIWIVSDTRRKTDIHWFQENYKGLCKTIRVIANPELRQQRGWKFVAGIDDAETECDLDDFDNWDLKIENNGNDVETILEKILELIN
ncbi:PREDICTED: phosphomevalonate kinase [Polistes canadensis]|uniref:phosphomevalonate kinase n=1 Tax=Polistes canadensis TaxID=91411 RepID=UPI000718DA04|nr:PREDICTED: phosphomevalonate kinase [Polistes canadensis]